MRKKYLNAPGSYFWKFSLTALFVASPLLLQGIIMEDGGPPPSTAISVDWTTSTAGTLAATNVTLSGTSPGAFGPQDLSTLDYSGASLSATTEVVQYIVTDNWTVTFSQPVSNLLLYGKMWLGGPSTVTFTFDQPFTILSGFAGAITTPTTLQLPAGSSYDGILQFAGPVTTLSETSAGAIIPIPQFLTFGLASAPVDVPTLTEWGIILLILVLAVAAIFQVKKLRLSQHRV